MRATWEEATTCASSVVLYPEVSAALAAASRSGRLDVDRLARAMTILDTLWERLDASDLVEDVAIRAGRLAELCALRGYDAVHLASAEAVLDEGDVMIVSDTRLAEAAASVGIDALVPAKR